VWEVSIDAKMKSIWGVVSKKGGAGSNPEDWAVTGYLRSMALLPLLQATRLSNLRKVIFIKFTIADNIQFHSLPSNSSLGLWANGSDFYYSILLSMFGGNIGTALNTAVNTAGYNFPGVNFRTTELKSVQYFEQLKITNSAAARYFNTYRFDWNEKGHSNRNVACRPRVGSDCQIRRKGEEAYQLIRIMVSVARKDVQQYYHHRFHI
jgi:hypothetical protein